MAAPKLLDRMRARLRTRHYSIRTEDTYVQWAKRYILFHGKQHPSAMGAPEINEFLTHLAVERNVSASTQSQALAAILFLYRDVLGEEVPWLNDLVRAPRRERGGSFAGRGAAAVGALEWRRTARGTVALRDGHAIAGGVALV